MNPLAVVALVALAADPRAGRPFPDVDLPGGAHPHGVPEPGAAGRPRAAGPGAGAVRQGLERLPAADHRRRLLHAQQRPRRLRAAHGPGDPGLGHAAEHRCAGPARRADQPTPSCPLVSSRHPSRSTTRLGGPGAAQPGLSLPALCLAIKSARIAEDVAAFGVEAARREILFGAAQLYFGAAGLKQAVSVQERLLAVQVAREKDAEVGFNAGAQPKVALLRDRLIGPARSRIRCARATPT